MALEISSSTIVCSRCGSGFKGRANHFYRNHGQNYRGIGYMTVCKECVDKTFEQYLAACADAKAAVRQVCRKYDLYWNEAAFEWAQKRNVTRNLVGAYMQKINNSKAYIGRSYDDSLTVDGRIWDFRSDEDIAADIDDKVRQIVEQFQKQSKEEPVEEPVVEEVVPEEPKEEIIVPDDIVDFWGPSYTPESYLELEKRKQYWLSRLSLETELDAGTEALVRQICMLEIDINKVRSEGGSADKLVNSLNTLLGSAQLRPTQKKDEASAANANTPFGVWIKRWEDERPIPEVDPSLKDVDGLIKYIMTWFHGHLAKMLGIKKAEVSLYEKEIERLRVERPEYAEEDDEEFLNDIFSDGGDSSGEGG